MALTAQPAHASATMAYKCTMAGQSARDWIQPLIFIAHNEATGQVVASDRVTLAFNDGQPAEARVAVDNPRRRTFAWDVDVVVQVSPTRMRYRATYMKASGEMTVSATPVAFSNSFNARGTCEVSQLGE